MGPSKIYTIWSHALACHSIKCYLRHNSTSQCFIFIFEDSHVIYWVWGTAPLWKLFCTSFPLFFQPDLSSWLWPLCSGPILTVSNFSGSGDTRSTALPTLELYYQICGLLPQTPPHNTWWTGQCPRCCVTPEQKVALAIYRWIFSVLSLCLLVS